MKSVGEGVTVDRVPFVGMVLFAAAVPVETCCSVLVIVLVRQVDVDVD
jgi:hypothetical protein